MLSKHNYLCKESREAWMKWRVAFCRARLKRAMIQARNLMFKENNHHRFKYPQNRYECKSLLIDDQIKTDTVEIASHFKEFYANLCSSSPSAHLEPLESTIADLEDKSYWNKEIFLILRLILRKLREP